MKILVVGDVVGGAGRKFFRRQMPLLRKQYAPDVVIVNGENLAHGKGLTPETVQEMYGNGADIITSGNHVWDKKEAAELLEREPYLLRPANYPDDVPGRGYCVYPFKAKNIGVLNLSGRTFMTPLDCPFRKADEIVARLKGEADIIILDFHAEATSEKVAMGWYLDGRVQGVFGTHTHVQTADERILPEGTAYITDLGMVGAKNSVLGVQIEPVLQKFTAALPVRFEPAEGSAIFSAVLVEFDNFTNRPLNIERILVSED